MADHRLKVLVVEDDYLHREALKRELLRNGFRVEVATNYKAAVEAGKDLDLAGAVVDLRLPYEPGLGNKGLWDDAGLDAIAEWKENGFDFPVVIASVKDEDEWKKYGYDLGARVYAVKRCGALKPYEVVMPLVNAIRADFKGELNVPPYSLTIDRDGNRVLRIRGEPKSLGPVHLSIMEYMMKRPNRIVRYGALKSFLSHEDVKDGAVHQQFRGLRKEVDPEKVYLENVRKHGYRLKPDNNVPTERATSGHSG